MSILAMVLAGLLIARFAPGAHDLSTLFALKGTGLPYSAILQLAGLSFILAVFCVLIVSNRFLVKMRFLLRFLLLLLAAFFTAAVFAVVFKWIPFDDVYAWIGLILSSVICYLIFCGITFVNFKLQDKKYNKLLENFKARH